MESLIFLYTCAAYSALQLSRTGDHKMGLRSSDYYKKVVALRDKIDTFQVPESRDYIFVAYDNLIRVIENPEVREPLKFLRAREVVHFQRFGEALEKIKSKLDEKNFYYFNAEFDKQFVKE